MFEGGGIAELAAWVSQLAQLPRDVTDEQRIDRLRLLEEITAAAAAAQVRDAADLHESRRAQHAAAGLPPRKWGEGVAAEIALARRLSPYRGGRLLGLARTLTEDMPHTLALMTAGRLSEWRATILVKETVCLEAADRRLVDEQLCGGDQPRAETLGDKALGAAAKALAVQFDAASVVARAARAESERCVSIRPAPDTMAYVTALLPMAAGVGVYAALKLAADCAPGEGDDRSRGQRMADTLVERVTGRNPLERPMDLDLRIVLPAATLVGGRSGDGGGATSSPSGEPDEPGFVPGGADDEPGFVPGYGPVPGPWVRRLIEEASLDDATRVLVRQLYAGPHGGLVAMASRARTAPAGLADLVQLRDRFCRTLWCDAEARHIDHIVRARDGGRTELANLQGLCERCNYAREAPGFVSRVVSQPAGDPVSRPRGAHEEQPERRPGGLRGGRHVVETTSPTGHTYRSTSPALAGDAVLPSAGFEDQWQLPDELDRDAPPPGELDEAGCGDIVLGLDLDTLRELSDVPAVRRLLSLLDAA
ncbi:MAG: DUF222 domain-containing protein [Actinomycetes bacterium]